MTESVQRNISLAERVFRAWLVLTVISVVSLFLYLLSDHYGGGMEFALTDCAEQKILYEEETRQALLSRLQAERQRRNLAEWIVRNEDNAGTAEFETMARQYRELSEQASTEIEISNEPLEECIYRERNEYNALFWSEFSQNTGPVLLIASLFILVTLSLLVSIYRAVVWIFK